MLQHIEELPSTKKNTDSDHEEFEIIEKHSLTQMMNKVSSNMRKLNSDPSVPPRELIPNPIKSTANVVNQDNYGEFVTSASIAKDHGRDSISKIIGGESCSISRLDDVANSSVLSQQDKTPQYSSQKRNPERSLISMERQGSELPPTIKREDGSLRSSTNSNEMLKSPLNQLRSSAVRLKAAMEGSDSQVMNQQARAEIHSLHSQMNNWIQEFQNMESEIKLRNAQLKMKGFDDLDACFRQLEEYRKRCQHFDQLKIDLERCQHQFVESRKEMKSLKQKRDELQAFLINCIEEQKNLQSKLEKRDAKLMEANQLQREHERRRTETENRNKELEKTAKALKEKLASLNANVDTMVSEALKNIFNPNADIFGELNKKIRDQEKEIEVLRGKALCNFEVSDEVEILQKSNEELNHRVELYKMLLREKEDEAVNMKKEAADLRLRAQRLVYAAHITDVSSYCNNDVHAFGDFGRGGEYHSATVVKNESEYVILALPEELFTDRIEFTSYAPPKRVDLVDADDNLINSFTFEKSSDHRYEMNLSRAGGMKQLKSFKLVVHETFGDNFSLKQVLAFGL